MKLYHAPRTRSGRPRWLLEELRDAGATVEFELVRLDLSKREHKTPEYLAIHPHGSLPALVDGDVTVIESAAICLYLGDKYIEAGLAPPFGSKERAHYYQWIIYAMATMEQQIVRILDDAGRVAEADRPALMVEARKKVETIAAVLTRALDGKEWILGDKFSAADVVLGGVAIWGNFLGLFDGHAAVQGYVKRLGARPASKRARVE